MLTFTDLLPTRNGPTFTDIFCGAGGSSIGLAMAGFELKLAANHWARAIETHSTNFRDAEHVCADVNNYDMRRLPKTDVLWASPICTEISPAGGRRRTRGQLDLLAYGSIEQGGFERTRATFHDVIRAAEVHRYKFVIVENVVEVARDWELFDWWLDGMRTLGYQVQFVSVSSAHVGGGDTPFAPQWRDRLYMVFTRTGIPLPDVRPRPLALCVECGEDVRAVQSWRNPDRRKIGKYRQQYDYRCPNSSCRHALVEPYVLPAGAAIDWTNLGTRIGDRKTPLAASTMRKIEVGLETIVAPQLVTVTHGGDDPRTIPVTAAPLPTRTAKIGEGLLVPTGGTWNTTAYPTDVPMRTRTANPKGYEAVVALPFITELRRNGAARSVDEPLATVTGQGNHHGLTIPPGAFYVKRYTPRGGERQMVKDAATEPFGAVTTIDRTGLVIPYRRTSKATTTGEPLHTLSTHDSAGLLRPAVKVEDCYYRMLQPREQLRAQCFPDAYQVHGNKGEQTMQAGNAVSANVAQWLGSALHKVLDGGAS